MRAYYINDDTILDYAPDSVVVTDDKAIVIGNLEISISEDVIMKGLAKMELRWRPLSTPQSEDDIREHGLNKYWEFETVELLGDTQIIGPKFAMRLDHEEPVEPIFEEWENQ